MLVLAASRDQAQVVFCYIEGFLKASPVLRQEIESTTASEIRLRSGVIIGVHANSHRSIRGRTLLACVFDEAALWRDEISATPDIEVYRAVLPALMTTNGMLIGISTPYRKIGLLYQKHRDHYAVDGDDVLVVQGPSTAFNPTLSQLDEHHLMTAYWFDSRLLVEDPSKNCKNRYFSPVWKASAAK